jgi:hypothetical protein
MEVVDMNPPTRFSDLARLPLARMRTDHRFEAHGDATRVTVAISIAGPLALLWDRIVARKLAADAQAHTAAFLDFARGQM